jgi:hypothetical protein
MVVVCFALPVAVPQLYQFEWHWPLPGSLDLGAILSLLPGATLVVLLAPLVSYRRRDALTIFVPLAGIQVAWTIGTRLGQLPNRNWPTRESLVPVQGRRAARIAMAVNRYRLWRQQRVERAAGADGTGLGPASCEPVPPLPSPKDQADSGGDPARPSGNAMSQISSSSPIACGSAT